MPQLHLGLTSLYPFATGLWLGERSNVRQTGRRCWLSGTDLASVSAIKIDIANAKTATTVTKKLSGCEN